MVEKVSRHASDDVEGPAEAYLNGNERMRPGLKKSSSKAGKIGPKE
jgi:hypothetical protein